MYKFFLFLFMCNTLSALEALRHGLANPRIHARLANLVKRNFSSGSMNPRKAYEMFRLDANHSYTNADLNKIRLKLATLYHPDAIQDETLKKHAQKKFQDIQKAMQQIKICQTIAQSEHAVLSEEDFKTIFISLEGDFREYRRNIEYQDFVSQQEEEAKQNEQKEKEKILDKKRLTKQLFAIASLGTASYFGYQYYKSQALINAIKENDIEKVKQLLAVMDTKALNAGCPLYYALINGFTEIAVLLVEDLKVNLHVVIRGYYVLGYATRAMDEEIIKALNNRVAKIVALHSKNKPSETQDVDDIEAAWNKVELVKKLTVSIDSTAMPNFTYDKARDFIIKQILEGKKLEHYDDIFSHALKHYDFEMVVLLAKLYPVKVFEFNQDCILLLKSLNKLGVLNKSVIRSTLYNKIDSPDVSIELLEELFKVYQSLTDKPELSNEYGNLWVNLAQNCQKLSKDDLIARVKLLKRFVKTDIIIKMKVGDFWSKALPREHIKNSCTNCVVLAEIYKRLEDEVRKENPEIEKKSSAESKQVVSSGHRFPDF